MGTSAELRVVEGGRKNLGHQLLRAMIEFRSEDVRAIADRIVRRVSLKAVETDADDPPRTEGTDAQQVPGVGKKAGKLTK